MVTRNDKTFCDMYEEWKMNQVQKQQKEYYDSLEKISKMIKKETDEALDYLSFGGFPKQEKSEGELWREQVELNERIMNAQDGYYKQEFTTNDDGTASVKNTTTEYDGKTTPSYYIGKHKQITAADVVADFGLSYNVGNAVVYLLRAGNKPNNPYLQDLIKAVHHLNMEIEQYKLNNNK